MSNNDAPPLPEAVVTELRHLSSKAHWDEREKGLISLNKLVEQEPSLFTRDVLRVLFRPLERQVRDLRSAIVRESCRLISTIVTILGDAANGIARMLLPVLSQVGISGNKIIAGYVDTSILDLVRCTHPSNAVSTFSTLLLESKSKDSRLLSATCMLVIIETWPVSVIERHFEELIPAISSALGDACSFVRETAREMYWNVKETLPDIAHRVYVSVSLRTQNMLDDHEAVPDGRPPEHIAATHSVSSSTSTTASSTSGRLNCTAPAALKHMPSTRTQLNRTHPIGNDGDNTHDGYNTANNNGFNTSSNSPSANSVRTTESTIDTQQYVALPALDSLVLVVAPSLSQPTAGHVRFTGETHFAHGQWVGVELEIPMGKNDGSVKGERYFHCRNTHGMFVRLGSVRPFTGIRKNLSSTVAATDGYGEGSGEGNQPDPIYHQQQQAPFHNQGRGLLVSQSPLAAEEDSPRYAFPHISSQPPVIPPPKLNYTHYQPDTEQYQTPKHRGHQQYRNGANSAQFENDNRVLQPRSTAPLGNGEGESRESPANYKLSASKPQQQQQQQQFSPQNTSFRGRCIALIERESHRIRDDHASLEREQDELDVFVKHLNETGGNDSSLSIGPSEFLRFATSVQSVLEARSNRSGDFSRTLGDLQEALLESTVTARR